MYQRDATLEGSNLGHVTPWAFCNVNYTKDPRDQKSTSRFVFMLASVPITWKSKKQASVALSTTKAEYYMLGIACQEAVWVMQLCQELYMSFCKLMNIYTDNTEAVALPKNPVFHNRSKHIDIHLQSHPIQATTPFTYPWHSEWSHLSYESFKSL